MMKMQKKTWKISELATACGGVCHGDATARIQGVCIDSRMLEAGNLFVALKTDTNDGHAYVQSAEKMGAGAVVVDRVCEGIHIPQIVVYDCPQALSDMGAYARDCFMGTVIGITGSVGKTSVKDSLHTVLESFAPTYATVGNFNNHLGVPITLLSIPDTCPYAVVEMGMSAEGEIRHLTHLVKPHVAIVTAVSQAHLESFENIAGIARAKAEIFEGLVGEKIAIYNVDSLHPEILESQAKTYADTIVTYDNTHIDFQSLTQTDMGQTARVCIGTTHHTVSIQGWGKHRVLNAVGVLHVVHALGQDVATAIQTLKNHTVSEGRGNLQSYVYNDTLIHVFDETYNSSPESVYASLHTIIQYQGTGRKIVVLGDMLELGTQSSILHENIYDKNLFEGLDIVYTCGTNMKYLFDACKHTTQAYWCHDIDALCRLVLSSLQHDDVILIKGSRGMKMDTLIQGIKSNAV